MDPNLNTESVFEMDPISSFFPAFSIISLLIGIGFILIFGFILILIFRNLKEWNKNNHSPKLTVPATVVAKRMDIRHYHSKNHADSTHTIYYVTFQVESGDRMELRVKGSEYGLMTEGDTGNVSFQGTRFLEFKRTV
jgi:hypothetical protein